MLLFSVTAPGEGDSSAKKKITVIGGPPKEDATEAASSPEKPADDSESALQSEAAPATPMTDAERAAKRAARFGVTPSATSNDKKAERAAR